ncbi:MAG: hypothetical protein U0794_16650 [Isosphaeraceae bacterium]
MPSPATSSNSPATFDQETRQDGGSSPRRITGRIRWAGDLGRYELQDDLIAAIYVELPRLLRHPPGETPAAHTWASPTPAGTTALALDAEIAAPRTSGRDASAAPMLAELEGYQAAGEG